MAKWKLKAIQVGSIVLDRSAMTHYKGKGEMITVPIWCAGATDGKHKVIIDTGIRDLAWCQEVDPGYQQEENQKTENAVKEIMGWNPEDVDIVVNTHLHMDHCGSNAHFKNAKFYVQRKEWESAYSPLVPEKPFYDRESFDKNAVSYFQWEFLDGETEILPGMKVIETPGHTRGHQSVLFDTDQGVVCVTGDICNVAENLNENLEPNIIISVPDTYESLEKIRRCADYIIPGHEPALKTGATEFMKVL